MDLIFFLIRLMFIASNVNFSRCPYMSRSSVYFKQYFACLLQENLKNIPPPAGYETASHLQEKPSSYPSYYQCPARKCITIKQCPILPLKQTSLVQIFSLRTNIYKGLFICAYWYLRALQTVDLKALKP